MRGYTHKYMNRYYNYKIKMKLNLIRPKDETEDLLLLEIKSVKRLFNKHIENLKKPSNSK